MYKDIISYELAENITEEHLLNVAQQIINHWMKQLPGFIKWEINKNNDGNYTDVVYWKRKDDAKNAEKEMANIPNAADWYSCYKPGSIKAFGITQIANFE